jgi:phage tail-like protein
MSAGSQIADIANSAGYNIASRDKTETLTTQFKIVISPMGDMFFRSCEGLEAEVEVISIPEGGSLDAPKTARGRARVNLISFGQGTTAAQKGSRTIFDWFKDVCDAGKPLKKESFSICLTTLSDPDKALAKWIVHQAWPCRWKAPIMNDDSSQAGLEYVTFAHEGIERST